MSNKDSRNISTNSAVTPFSLPNVYDAPSDAKEIKFCERYSRVNPCLCTQLDIESRIVEADMLFISTKSRKKVLGSEESGNTVLMQIIELFSCLKQ
jgi:hypothetical protein